MLYSKYNDVRVLVKATVKLYFHGYPRMPAGWINASESCHDSWCDIVVDDSISVTVALKYLQYNTIQYNKNLSKHGTQKKTKTDSQDCRVGVTIDIDKDNNLS